MAGRRPQAPVHNCRAPLVTVRRTLRSTMPPSAWQDPHTAHRYLEDRRAAIPYGADQLRLMLQLVRHFRLALAAGRAPRFFLDLGCGDGVLARVLLEAFPEARALLIDHSPPMLERAAAAMRPYGSRYELRLADLSDPLSASDMGDVAGDLDLVVSGFAIHHLPQPRKRSLYGEIYTLLAQGGVFINIEHVASPTRTLEQLFEQLYIDHIAEHTGRPRAIVEHEYLTRPDRADNVLEAVEPQLAWLRDAGFEHVDCYFKWLELAVFGGVKGFATE